MADWLQSFFPHTLTFWPRIGTDGFGAPVFGAPASFPGRWLQKQDLYRNAQGEEIRSNAIAYTEQTTIHNGGYLYKGASAATDPLEVEGAREVQAVNESLSVDSLVALYKIFL